LKIAHAPSPKNLSKNGFCPLKGVAFLTEDGFEKKISGAGEDSAVGASASGGNSSRARLLSETAAVFMPATS
jgi:hypothetical protein